MGIVEAQLIYRPSGMNSKDPVPIPVGQTDDPAILRSLRNRLLADADHEVEVWENIDAGVAAMHRAEAGRLAGLLPILVPDDEPDHG
jgi:hypothetical protein